jgi:integrase
MSNVLTPQSTHSRIIQAVWSTFTHVDDGLPISREACAILLFLVTVRPPRYILPIRTDEIDFGKAIWNVPEQDGKPAYRLPLTRLAIALVRHAHAFKQPRDGDFLFPGCFDRQIPMAPTVLSRTFRRAGLAPTNLIRRPAYDLPAAAAWVMVEAGVKSDDVEAVMHRTSQHEMLRREKFIREGDWIFERSQIALEAFEEALMSIVGLTYSDPLFRSPRFPPSW